MVNEVGSNMVIIVPAVLFAGIGFGLVSSLLFLLLHKVKIVKVSFLPLFIFSTIVYLAVTFALGYFYIASNTPPAAV
ncbi:MAG: hypothetical protein LBC07_05420 [Elusimicrobiota bacterium]|jgi:hypothetical protein|nr:hypothetical protein [Elusimicrobiota bacterium]